MYKLEARSDKTVEMKPSLLRQNRLTACTFCRFLVENGAQVSAVGSMQHSAHLPPYPGNNKHNVKVGTPSPDGLPTIHNLKDAAERVTGIPAASQRVIFKGKKNQQQQQQHSHQKDDYTPGKSQCFGP